MSNLQEIKIQMKCDRCEIVQQIYKLVGKIQTNIIFTLFTTEAQTFLIVTILIVYFVIKNSKVVI